MPFSDAISKALARCPLWSLLLGVISGVLIGDFYNLSWWWLEFTAGSILTLCTRNHSLRLFLIGLILAHGTHGLTLKKQKEWLNSLDPSYQTLHIKLEGVIIDTGNDDAGPYLLKVTKSDQGLRLGVRLLLSIPHQFDHANASTPLLQYGDQVQASGYLTPIPEPRNPHGFDRAAWLHRQGTDLILRTDEVPAIQGVSLARKPVRLMNQWRVHLRKKMTSGLDDHSQEAQLIRAVVLGERPPHPSIMLEDFRHSGTLHVFAVSGLHVGMVGTIIGLTLYFIRVPRWMLITLTILGMACYAGITGLRPPSVRAVIMATVFLSGFLMQRRPTLMNSLAASAVIVLLWDGHQLFTPGFQLSYGVLLSLALLAGMWARLLRPLGEIDPFIPHLLLTSWQELRLNARKWLKNSLSISAAAWMGSAPLMWIHFGIITPIAIIAGIPLMIMVFLILLLTMISLIVSSLWQPAGDSLVAINAIIARSTYNTAALFADTPGSHFYSSTNTEEEQIIVFDIPYGGGATWINLGGGILLDSGGQAQFQRHVLPTLSALRSSPDSFIITHAESAHSGGMKDSLDHFNPKQALIPRKDLRSPSYQEFLKNAAQQNCKLIVPHTQQTFQIKSGAHLEILHAPAEIDGYGLADNTCLVIRLHWNGWRILFTGDAGFATEMAMLDSGIDLNADIIVMGRNAHDYSGTESFLDAVSPLAIISSHADFPESERIPKAWIELLHKRKISLFDQKRTGAVTITHRNSNLILTPSISGTSSLTLDFR